MINETPQFGKTSIPLVFLLTLAIFMLAKCGSSQSGDLEAGSGIIGILFTVLLFWTIMINASFKSTKSQARLLVPLIVAILVLLVYAALKSEYWEDGLGFAAVLLAATAPMLLWIRAGMVGVPILQACAALYVIYFGLSALLGVGEQEGYKPQQVLTACLTVAVFLMIATFVNFWICTNWASKHRANTRSMRFSDRQVVRLTYVGLGLGLLFYAGQLSGMLDWLGTLWSVVRSISLSAVALASFLLGYATARKILKGPTRLVLFGAFLGYLFLSLSTLFLVGVVTIALSALAGYIVTARRVPWGLLLIAFLTISIFQAGKKEMRDQYWEYHADYSTQISLISVPSVIVEWFEVGTDALLSGTSGPTVVDRTSLLNQLIRVEDWTPKFVPYLYGDSYTYLPYIIVPRFVLPDKPTSQIVMNKLDVRYGFLLPSETRYVAVGINLVSEAFANFGYFGIVLIGIVFGALTGFFSRLSIGQNPVSLPVLLSIVTFVTFLDLEADLSFLLTTLVQSLVSVTVFFFVFQFVFEPKYRRVMLSRAPKSTGLRPPLGRA